MQDQLLMETGVVQAMMQFGRGSFQAGWEQSEAPIRPNQNYKEDKGAVGPLGEIHPGSGYRLAECRRQRKRPVELSLLRPDKCGGTQLFPEVNPDRRNSYIYRE